MSRDILFKGFGRSRGAGTLLWVEVEDRRESEYHDPEPRVDQGDAGIADNFSYWTSSQSSADMATHIDFPDNGRQHSDDKDFPRRVRAVRMV